MRKKSGVQVLPQHRARLRSCVPVLASAAIAPFVSTSTAAAGQSRGSWRRRALGVPSRDAEGATAGEKTTSPRDPNVLISVVASTAAAVTALMATEAWREISPHLLSAFAFLALTFVLQVTSVEVYNRGSISFAGTGLLAVGFGFGVGAALIAAAIMGFVNLVRRRGKLNRGVFDMAQMALAAGTGAAIWHVSGAERLAPEARLGISIASAAGFMVVNIGLLSVAMGLAEGDSPLNVWRERFRWFTPYNLASGPLALAVTLAYDKLSTLGLLAFALPPAMMMISIKQYVSRTTGFVEEVRRANDELKSANVALAERNADLQALFQFAGGLAANAHDRATLVAYAEQTIGELTGAQASLSLGGGEGGVGLVTGGRRIAGLHLSQTPGFEGERWQRLRETILPQLATALESSELIDQVRKKHLATIAALSRSMEAKDYYTGGHTERVSAVAVALARRLGLGGAELDAIEIAALLHDIGKIGIPERILHKAGPLDEEEWKVMKDHPIISEYILSDVDLHPYVCQVARSSHERMDGAGYPDGLVGNEIPLPARIVLVADAFDALTSDRPYRRGRSVRAAMEELRAHAGSQFCPRVVNALEKVYREEPQLLGLGRQPGVDIDEAA
jgi:hypothetical protein